MTRACHDADPPRRNHSNRYRAAGPGHRHRLGPAIARRQHNLGGMVAGAAARCRRARRPGCRKRLCHQSHPHRHQAQHKLLRLIIFVKSINNKLRIIRFNGVLAQHYLKNC